MTAGKMIVAYAAVAVAIWASRGAPPAMTTFFYGTIFETICSTTKARLDVVDISAFASLISTSIIRLVALTDCLCIA